MRPDHTGTRVQIVLSVMFAVTFLCSGCGSGSGIRTNPIDDDDDSVSFNDNVSDDSNLNDNTADDDNSEFMVVASVDPLDSIAVGDEVQLSAAVPQGVSTVQFTWSLDPQTAGIISNTNSQSPTLTLTEAGSVAITVEVTNVDDGSVANDTLSIEVGDSEGGPPDEASISTGEDRTAFPGDIVTLLSSTTGPAPETIVWSLTESPGLTVESLNFLDFGDGMAQFVPFDLGLTYQLVFTVTATYESGFLSDTVTITVIQF